MDLAGFSYMNFALIDGFSFSKCSSIIKLNVDTWAVGIGAFIADTLISKAQICIHLQTRGLAFSVNKFLKHSE